MYRPGQEFINGSDTWKVFASIAFYSYHWHCSTFIFFLSCFLLPCYSVQKMQKSKGRRQRKYPTHFFAPFLVFCVFFQFSVLLHKILPSPDFAAVNLCMDQSGSRSNRQTLAGSFDFLPLCDSLQGDSFNLTEVLAILEAENLPANCRLVLFQKRRSAYFMVLHLFLLPTNSYKRITNAELIIW